MLESMRSSETRKTACSCQCCDDEDVDPGPSRLNLRQGLAERLSSHDVATEWLGMSALEGDVPMVAMPSVEDSGTV